MYDPETDREPVTEAQRERLKQLGLGTVKPVGRKHAEWLIDHFSATGKQLECLQRFGQKPEGTLRRHEASATISREIAQRRTWPPTPKQERFLRERGRWREGMTRGEAYDLIGKLLGRGEQ